MAKKKGAKFWKQVRADYEAGKFKTNRELAQAHNVHEGTISRKAKKEGWKPYAQATAEAAELAAEKRVGALAFDMRKEGNESILRVAKLSKAIQVGIGQATQKILRGPVPARDDDGNPVFDAKGKPGYEPGVGKTVYHLLALSSAVRNMQEVDRINFRMDDIKLDQDQSDFDKFLEKYAEHFDDNSFESGMEGVD